MKKVILAPTVMHQSLFQFHKRPEGSKDHKRKMRDVEEVNCERALLPQGIHTYLQCHLQVNEKVLLAQ